MNTQDFLKEMTGSPVNGSPSQPADSDIMINEGGFRDDTIYDAEEFVSNRTTAPGEVSQEAIKALMGGAKPHEVKTLNNRAIMESTTDIPADALRNLIGGNIQEAKQKAVQANKISRMLSVDDPMKYVTNTKTILEERIKAKAAAKGLINESPIQKTASLPGISQEEIDRMVEDKVMDILQNMAELKGVERKNSEVLMVIGDKIFKGNLKMIGKIK